MILFTNAVIRFTTLLWSKPLPVWMQDNKIGQMFMNRGHLRIYSLLDMSASLHEFLTLTSINELKSSVVNYNEISISIIKAANPFVMSAITSLVNKCLIYGMYYKQEKIVLYTPCRRLHPPSVYWLQTHPYYLPCQRMSKGLLLNRWRNIFNILKQLETRFRTNHGTYFTNCIKDFIVAKDKSKNWYGSKTIVRLLWSSLLYKSYSRPIWAFMDLVRVRV